MVKKEKMQAELDVIEETLFDLMKKSGNDVERLIQEHEDLQSAIGHERAEESADSSPTESEEEVEQQPKVQTPKRSEEDQPVSSYVPLEIPEYSEPPKQDNILAAFQAQAHNEVPIESAAPSNPIPEPAAAKTRSRKELLKEIEDLKQKTELLEQEVDQAAEAEDYEKAEEIQEQVDANTQLIEKLEAELETAPEEEEAVEPVEVRDYSVPDYSVPDYSVPEYESQQPEDIARQDVEELVQSKEEEVQESA